MKNITSEQACNLEGTRVFHELDNFVRSVTELYSAVLVNRDLWLTEREKDFFVAIVIMYDQGIKNITSADAISIYEKIIKRTPKKSEVNTYFLKLREKKWVTGKVNEVDIPLVFRHLIQDSAFKVKIELRHG